MTYGGGSRKGCLLAERLSRRYEVWLISRDRPDVQALGRSYGVSLADVRFHCLGGGQRAAFLGLGCRGTALPPSGQVHSGAVFVPYRRLRDLELDLFIHNTSSHYMKAPAPRGIFMCMFPWPMAEFPRPRWCRLPLLRQFIDYGLAHTLDRYRHAHETYDLITANSEFTATWIKRLWNRDAQVVYSATELTPPAPRAKEKIILMVGRYNPDKKQDVLIEAFRSMCELHESGWELHLAGKINAGDWSRRYHDKLVEHAHGLPVVFHYDLSIGELRELYGRSAIYWHAKGFGIPEDQPQRMEHFGNTPLEAMSAGCVPVVMDAGGLRETVQHGINGFRWTRIEELHEYTLRFARNPELLAKFRTRAMQIDPRFGVEPFLRAVEVIVEDVLDLEPCATCAGNPGCNEPIPPKSCSVGTIKTLL